MPIWLCERALHSALPDLELQPGNRLQTDPMSLAEAMSTAGFADVRLQKLDPIVEVASPRGAWDVMRAALAMLGDRWLRALDDRAADDEDQDRGAGGDNDERCHQERRSRLLRPLANGPEEKGGRPKQVAGQDRVRH